MEPRKILFLSSLFGILVLIILTQTLNQYQTGEIESIKISNNKVTIDIKNLESELILFGPSTIKPKEGNIIKFKGKEGIYQNQSQIIVDKLFLLNNNNS